VNDYELSIYAFQDLPVEHYNSLGVRCQVFDLVTLRESISKIQKIMYLSGIFYVIGETKQERWSLVCGLWFVVSGLWSLVSGLWSLVSGLWFVVSGLWSLVRGSWFLVCGLWFVVHEFLAEVLNENHHGWYRGLAFQLRLIHRFSC